MYQVCNLVVRNSSLAAKIEISGRSQVLMEVQVGYLPLWRRILTSYDILRFGLSLERS